MSIRLHERLEKDVSIETLSKALNESRARTRLAWARVDALELELQRLGWTEEDLCNIKPTQQEINLCQTTTQQ